MTKRSRVLVVLALATGSVVLALVAYWYFYLPHSWVAVPS